MTNVSLERLIDRYVGGVLCFLCRSKTPDQKSKIKDQRSKIESILVVRLWTLGETLLTLPMMKRLREEFPDTKITVLARDRNKGIFKYVDFVDEILSFEAENIGKILKMRGKFDLAIDTEPYLRISGLLARFLGKRQIGFDHGVRGRVYGEKVRYDADKHCAEIMCDLLWPLGIKYRPDELVRLEVSGQAKRSVKAKLDKFSKGKIIGMHPSTAESATYRAWPKKRFAALINALDTTVVLTGAKGEHKFNEEIVKMCRNERVVNLAGLLSFEEFIALFDYLEAYVSNDTGPMHLAAAQGCKTIGLFGPNLPERFGPYPLSENKAIYCAGELPCSPCISVHTGKFRKCQRIKDGTGECMTLIGVDAVLNQISKK
ncbi:MAG: glycosyltransferase family 9 protein [Patescibacteria group bacterium]|nr:glycosyltransferase family 9 protein [Patescibacteria group bacterium]